MLLAVEGGGFFSSSASGYSKGLTVLLLGKNTEDKDKPMRVTPWNHYQLVDHEPDPDLDLQLASNKNRLVRGCASFLCFGRTAAGLDSPSLKVGVAQNQPDVVKSGSGLEKVCESDLVVDDDNVNGVNEISLRSSLKRPSTTVTDSVSVNNKGESDNNGGSGHTERRVQWMDVSGGELFVVREFEPSEQSGSDDEFENGNERSCSCRLM